MLLDSIQKPNDIKNIDPKDYDELAAEIRQFLIEKISVNGGHLGSNLGAVELTMALHLVLDLPEDKIIWDVGHQSYTHKILSGRKDGFDGLSSAINSALAESDTVSVDTLSRDSIINMPPRLRMSTLYAIAQALPNGGRVANTCNRSEDFNRYFNEYDERYYDGLVMRNGRQQQFVVRQPVLV